ncbi:hypothetical protein B0H16DRAFT_890904 [Mycena metata]|uniref:Uncharacterized protein n=1 Tax=Mycena metata TaxID=1033252 RepID=A0AAD7ITN7_9AGAR|nr:hypothetical protein B0H16DRAFT_890904 [Mycena metata]
MEEHGSHAGRVARGRGELWYSLERDSTARGSARRRRGRADVHPKRKSPLGTFIEVPCNLSVSHQPGVSGIRRRRRRPQGDILQNTICVIETFTMVPQNFSVHHQPGVSAARRRWHRLRGDILQNTIFLLGTFIGVPHNLSVRRQPGVLVVRRRQPGSWGNIEQNIDFLSEPLLGSRTTPPGTANSTSLGLVVVSSDCVGNYQMSSSDNFDSINSLGHRVFVLHLSNPGVPSFMYSRCERVFPKNSDFANYFILWPKNHSPQHLDGRTPPGRVQSAYI